MIRPSYENGSHRLFLGDCLEILPEIPDGSVQCIWTDPPYGNNNNNNDLIARREACFQGGTYDPEKDVRPIQNDGPEEMERVVRGMLSHAGRILEKESCCCCCCSGGGPTPIFAKVSQWMDEKPLQFFHAVVWDKGGLGMGFRYRRNYEFVMVAHRSGGKLRWFDDSKKVPNVVRINKIIPRQNDHPTPKPVELVSWFLRKHCKPGDTVLDPFMGHSPVGEACYYLGLKYIGIELDPEHFRSSVKRIDYLYSQADLFIG